MRVRSQLSTRRTATALLAVGVLALTACGTRLPDKDFTAAGSSTLSQGNGNNTASNAPGTNAPGTNAQGNQGTQGTQGTKGSSNTKGGKGSNGSNGQQLPAGQLFGGACGGGSSGGKSSDVGVTGSAITIGNVSSIHNQFGSSQFSPNVHGLDAFVKHCNAVGGVNGRKIVLLPCDDGGGASGNSRCVNSLISKNAFAFVANNVFAYGGAATLSAKNRPDIGGEPIEGPPYYKYSNFYNIYGTGYPRDNKQVGYKGKYWGTAEIATWVHAHYPQVKSVGIVYYTQTDSQRGAAVEAAGFDQVGIKTHLHAVNLSNGNYQGAVAQMQADGDEMVMDALDDVGNQQLCQAMDQPMQSGAWKPIAKISTISTWNADVGKNFAPPCRDIVWAAGSSASYSDSSVPMAQTFLQDFQQFEPGVPVAQWGLEGYAAGIWFAQAAHSCGASLTRTCVEHWLDSQKSLGASGLMSKDTNFQHVAYSTSSSGPACVSIVKWDNGKNSWDTLANINRNCYPNLKYFDYDIG
ncbi:MAG: ABC transporter substrate-binding protein [Actinomycetes bacterium]